MAGNTAAVVKGLAKFLTNPVVHQNVHTYVVPVLTTMYSWYNGPSEENPTIQEIKARILRQKSESVEQQKRRVVQEKKDMEDQRRMEGERERNDLALSREIQQKNSELILLRCKIEQLRIEQLQRQREYDMASEHERQAAEQAEQSRIEMRGIFAEAAIQTTNALYEARIASVRHEELRRASMRRAQVARQVEDRRRAQDEDRRAGAARQAVQRRRTEDERLLVIAAMEAEEIRRIEVEENRRAEAERLRDMAAMEAEEEEIRRIQIEKQRAEAARQAEETKRADEARRSIQQRTENGNSVRALMEAEGIVAQKALEVEQLEHQRLEARRQNSERLRLALWPYLEEYETAKKSIQYDPDTFMFAVAGMAGVGKSSLINIFLNLKSKDAGAARMGTTETTRMITRYPDPGQQPPRKWTVWYDIPGAGTVKIPAWMYFNNQSLFLFDVILLLVGDRFLETDLEILKQCRTFGIPSMIVRSKSDSHIRNMASTRAEENDVEIDDAILSECREQYIADTRENIATQLLEASLPPQPVYLVSSHPAQPFREAYSSFAGGPAFGGDPRFIDEMKLIHDLLIAASQRRGGSTPGHRDGTQQDGILTEIPRDSTEGGMQGELNDTTREEGEPTQKGTKDGVIPSTDWVEQFGWVKQHGWGRQQQSTSSQSSSSRYIPPGQRTAAQFSRVSAGSKVLPKDAGPLAHTQQAHTPVEEAMAIITLAFSEASAVPAPAELIREIRVRVKEAQLLVLSMTRDLAFHVQSVLQSVVEPMKLRSVVCVRGGKEPRGWQHIVSGTPVRVANLIIKGSLSMTQIRVLVLNMEDVPEEFYQEIFDVYRLLPAGTKILRGLVGAGSTG